MRARLGWRAKRELLQDMVLAAPQFKPQFERIECNSLDLRLRALLRKSQLTIDLWLRVGRAACPAKVA